MPQGAIAAVVASVVGAHLSPYAEGRMIISRDVTWTIGTRLV